jgi:hypothetical protein
MRMLLLLLVASLVVLLGCGKRHRLNQWADQELNRFQANALAELVHGGPAIDLWPRRLWRITEDDGSPRFLMLETNEDVFRTSAAIHLLDKDGTKLRSWDFPTGPRLHFHSALLTPWPEAKAWIIEMRMIPRLGPRIAWIQFAYGHETLRLIRIEDLAGSYVRSDFHDATHAIGFVPEANHSKDYLDLLQSDWPPDVLAALMVLNGIHPPLHREAQLPPRTFARSTLVQEALRDPDIQAMIAAHATSADPLVREAAIIAAGSVISPAPDAQETPAIPTASDSPP